MQNPPATFEEFLTFKHLKDWPEIPSVEDPFHNELISVPRYSMDMIHEEFMVNVPFSESTFGDVEAKIAKNIVLLDNYASKILCLPAVDDDKHSLEKVFLTEAEMPELSHNAQENSKATTRINLEENESCVEKCVFPGFDRTNLPGNLKAPQILQNIANIHKLKERTGIILLKLLLSEKSVAIFQDCFWWFFLNKFKQIEEDYLFDRISDTFVTLLFTVPQDIKDLFFQMYPDYLSQAIFTAFYKAFPQSRAQFNGEIKTEIVDHIFQWFSGIKPVPCSWKKWDLGVLDWPKNDQNASENVNTSQISYLTDVRRRLEFNLDDILEEVRRPNPSRTLDTEDKDTPMKESHLVGPGPEFHRVLFQLGGHSLLVSNYLKRHRITGYIHGRSQHRVKRTEISHLPSVGPTYQDIIKETQKLRKSFQQEYEMLETETQKELAEIGQQNVKMKRTIEKIKQEVSSGGKLNSTLLMKKLQKMPFSSKLFRKKDLTIQDVLDADSECEPSTKQTLVML
ncbi:protein FAM227B [Dendropsophus ebraccatus]|uniref:protein FAM227B n=1 Tax=Dendropsophus ebraccatus TaxID=150705 RepID=UPI00383109E7